MHIRKCLGRFKRHAFEFFHSHVFQKVCVKGRKRFYALTGRFHVVNINLLFLAVVAFLPRICVIQLQGVRQSAPRIDQS